MWIVVYLTQSKEDADNLATLIAKADILFKLRHVNNSSQDGENEVYEILVTDSDVDKVHNIIIDAQL